MHIAMRGPTIMLLALAPAAILLGHGCAELKPGEALAPAADGAADAATEDDAGRELGVGMTASDAAMDAGATDALAGATACPTISTGASIFVLDSTQTLFAFDERGNSQGSVTVPSTVNGLNGGGMALASGHVYVTTGQPNNGVIAYNPALSPSTLPDGSFPSLSVPRGIAYDCRDSQFYIANGAAAVSVFLATGSPVAVDDGGFSPDYGPSGAAYDPDDEAIWITNYPGYPTTAFGVSEFSETGETRQDFDRSKQFVAPGVHQESYSITVCSKAATGSATLVVVGFIDDGSGFGTGAVQAYSTDGIPRGGPLAGPFLKPYALSCDSHGRVYVADSTGLYAVDLSGGGRDAGLPGPFAGLTPPIYGVLAGD